MMLFHYPFMLPALVGLPDPCRHTHLFRIPYRAAGVIFVDLALSQIAALGASVALVVGWGDDAPLKAFCVSLGFTFGGAVLLRFCGRARRRCPWKRLSALPMPGR